MMNVACLPGHQQRFRVVRAIWISDVNRARRLRRQCAGRRHGHLIDRDALARRPVVADVGDVKAGYRRDTARSRDLPSPARSRPRPPPASPAPTRSSRYRTGASESLCVHSTPPAYAMPLASGTAGRNCGRPDRRARARGRLATVALRAAARNNDGKRQRHFALLLSTFYFLLSTFERIS